MCGVDTSKRIRVGALAVLNPPDGIPPSTTFRGELSLGPSNTRVRFAELLTEELETAQPITHLRVTIQSVLPRILPTALFLFTDVDTASMAT